jgi:hypothetical protein
MRQKNSTTGMYQAISNSAVCVESNVKAGIADIFFQDSWSIFLTLLLAIRITQIL